MLTKLLKFFRRNQELEKACDMYERFWLKECVDHAQTKVDIAKEGLKNVVGTLHTAPEDYEFEEAYGRALENLSNAYKDLGDYYMRQGQ